MRFVVSFTPMTSKPHIERFLDDYLRYFPDEMGRCSIFNEYLSRTADEYLYTRKNFDGHITASAFILNGGNNELLLLQHKSLKKWLQPGGHVEGDLTLLDSALREVEEECGIPGAELELVRIFDDRLTPFDIDSHFIPENPKKNEDGHYHHDIRFLFRYTGNGLRGFNEDEATGMRWVSFDELNDDLIFGDMVTKMKTALKLIK